MVPIIQIEFIISKIMENFEKYNPQVSPPRIGDTFRRYTDLLLNSAHSLHVLHSEGLAYFIGLMKAGGLETIVSRITENGISALQERETSSRRTC